MKIKHADIIFKDALASVLNNGSLVEAPKSNFSPHSSFRGEKLKILELRDWYSGNFIPGDIYLHNIIRKASNFRSLGMALWNVRASQEVNEVSFYNPLAVEFSDNGYTIRSPWGYRIFGPDIFISPINKAILLLTKDSSTQRAIIPVYREDDIYVESKDVPCLTSISLAIRQRTLVATASFRSLNAFSVFPYDLTLIVIIIEILRSHLMLEEVNLSLFVSSLHLREKDIEKSKLAVDYDCTWMTNNSQLGFRLPNCELYTEHQKLCTLEPKLQNHLKRKQKVDNFVFSNSSESWAQYLLSELICLHNNELIK
jgi:thymidylate synthase